MRSLLARLSRSTLARGATQSFAVQVAGVALAYGLHVLLARWLGAAEYGAFAYVTAWASLAAMVAAGGFPMTTLRFAAQYRGAGDWGLLRGLLRYGFLWTAAAGLVAGLLGELWLRLGGIGGSIASPVAWRLGLWTVLPLALMQLLAEVARALGWVVLAYAPLKVVRPLATGVLLAVWLRVAPPVGSEEVLAAVLAISAVLLLAQGWLVRRRAPPEVHHAAPRQRGGEWLAVSGPLLLAVLFTQLIQQTDVLVLGLIGDAESVGVYQAAAKTATLVTFVLYAVNTVAAPRFATLYAQGRTGELAALVRQAAHAIFWPTLGVVAFLVAAGRPVLRLFGPAFDAAYAPLVLLVLAQLVNAGVGSVAYLLNMTGRQRHTMWVVGCCAVANVALNAVLIPRLGLLGAALASGLSIVAWNLWLHRIVVRELGFSPSILAALRG